ncbi:MAG: 3-isopropylmalate dehydratase large subunit [Planctomycetota bacterium]
MSNFVYDILTSHYGQGNLKAGQIINVKVDYVMGNELSTILSLQEFKKLGVKKVYAPEKIIIIPDHFTPAKDIKTAQLCKVIRSFVKEFDIKNYYEVGRGGIAHVVVMEEGFATPGKLIIGGDSHTCTYGALGVFATGVGSTDLAYAFAFGEIWLKVPPVIEIKISGKPQKGVYGKDIVLYILKKITVEGGRYKAILFTGETLQYLPINERFTLCNMSAEMGAKVGIIKPDKITWQYLDRIGAKYSGYESRTGGDKVDEKIEINIDNLEPQIAKPFSPDNVCDIKNVEGIKVDQVVIGSCTNGYIEDLRLCAEILKGRKVHPDVRLIILPGSQKVYLEAVKEGLIRILTEAGAVVSPSTCGPCIGGYMGVLGEKEVCFATTSRNFKGRMGALSAEIYLGSPATAAATAINGKITDPRNYL